MGLPREGMRQARKASEICEPLGDTMERAWFFISLAWSLSDDKQLDAVEEAAFHAISLIPEKGNPFPVY